MADVEDPRRTQGHNGEGSGRIEDVRGVRHEGNHGIVTRLDPIDDRGRWVVGWDGTHSVDGGAAGDFPSIETTETVGDGDHEGTRPRAAARGEQGVLVVIPRLTNVRGPGPGIGDVDPAVLIVDHLSTSARRPATVVVAPDRLVVERPK